MSATTLPLFSSRQRSIYCQPDALVSSLPIRIDVDISSSPMQPPPEPYGAVRMITIREDQTAGISVVDPGASMPPSP